MRAFGRWWWKGWENPAWASRKYPTLFTFLDLIPQAYAWPIIVYSKKDISQLRDECKTFVEKLFDNSGHTFSSTFQKTKARGQDQCDTEAVCDTQQPQNVTTHQILDFYLI